MTDEDVSMEIFLINGKSVTVSGQSFSRSDEVLEVYHMETRIASNSSLSFPAHPESCGEDESGSISHLLLLPLPGGAGRGQLDL